MYMNIFNFKIVIPGKKKKRLKPTSNILDKNVIENR